jgi:uncharacterized MAPEG superfamily protein
MDLIAIVTVLALLQFFWFGIEVGQMRGKYEIKAPAVSGDPAFERMFRVQQNTMEQLVLFLPALWLYAQMVKPLWGAGFAVAYLIGRFMYRIAYVRDPAGRSAGFAISSLPAIIMLTWVMVVAVLRLF